MQVWVPILVALITGPLVAIINKLRKENTEQHAESRGILTHILHRIERLDEKIDEHILEHHKESV